MTKVVQFEDYKKKKTSEIDGGLLPLEGLFSAAYVSWYLCGDDILGDYFMAILSHAWYESGEWSGFVTREAYDQYVAYATEKKRYVYPLKAVEAKSKTA